MNKRLFVPVAAVLTSTTALLVLLLILGRGSSGISGLALAAPLQVSPTIFLIDPSSAPNDLDTAIIITGSGFISMPVVTLGDAPLDDVSWVSITTLKATVPWGIDPGVLTITVTNPGGESGSLPGAFTVTLGIDMWNSSEFYGGNINQIIINPLTPATIYATSAEVGIFRSWDSGENWSFIYAPTARNMVVDPANPETVYWGGGGSLFRSDDEGDTWISLYDAPGYQPYPHPTQSGTVFVSHLGEENAGLWKSTNYGQRWVTVTTGLTDTRVADLLFHPSDPMTVVLGTVNGNIFVSSDGGESWTFASDPVEYVQSIAFNPFGTNELWVSDCCFCVPAYTFKSTNLEYTDWITTLASSLTSINFPDPDGWGETYSRTVYAAGCWDNAYKTTDSGGMWEPWGPESWGEIALDPKTPDHLYKASYQVGAYETTDGGDTWRVVNQGMTAMIPHQLETVRGQPDEVYALVEGWEGIFRGTRGGGTWQFMEVARADDGPDGSMLVDPHEPWRVYRSGREDVFRSDDAGLTWMITGTLESPDACSMNGQLVAPRVMRADPDHPGTLLAGTNIICNDFDVMMGGIYISMDYAETWTLIDVGQEISQVLDLAYDVQTPTIVYAATEGTGFLRSTNGGQIWQPMGEDITALDNVVSIAVEPSEPYRVFALAGLPYGGVYVSEDHGKKWTQATSGFLGRQILFTEEEPSVLYAATTEGLYLSTDGAQSWSRVAGELGYVPIYSLATVDAVDRTILYAGTTGGFVESGTAHMLGLRNLDGTLVSAGVYRYTTRRTWELYLPLEFKD